MSGFLEAGDLCSLSDCVRLFIIFLTIVILSFVAGVGVGIITACVTFVVNTARVQLVKHAINRGNFSSRVDRPIYQIETLQKMAREYKSCGYMDLCSLAAPITYSRT